MFRRDFLITTLAVAAPAAAFAQDINWRLSCDVLVVGAGGAGLAAAVRASELGAEVILIEQNAQHSYLRRLSRRRGSAKAGTSRHL